MTEPTDARGDADRPPMPDHRRTPWWQRKGPSGLVFVLVIGALLVATVTAVAGVAGVLSEVGKDQQGEDPWTDRLGVEKVGIFQIAHIPDCAAGPLKGIELWDEDSKPYWKVQAPVDGPGTPMSTFAIGATPEGWTVITPYEEPPASAVLRLVVVRGVQGVAGVRFRQVDLRTGYVVTGVPSVRYGLDRFQSGDLCNDGTESSGTTTSTTGA